MRHDRVVEMSLPLTRTLPLVGCSSCSSSWLIVDLPEPDGPMKTTKSPFSIDTDTSSSDGREAFGYVLVTCSSRITSRKCTRCNGSTQPYGVGHLWIAENDTLPATTFAQVNAVPIG